MALDLNDKTSNGNNLTNNGVAEYTTSFPFADCTEAGELVIAQKDYFIKSDSASLSLTGDLTLEICVRFTSTPTNGNAVTLISKFNDVSGAKYSYIWQLRNVSNNLQSWFSYSNLGTNPSSTGVNWTPSLNTWYRMAVSLKASTKAVNYYIDGSQQGTTQTGAYTSIHDNASPFVIGAWDTENATPSDLLGGQVTEVRVWSVERSSTDINNNKNNHLTGTETGLNAYWPFQSLTTPSSIKTINGLAKASVKTVNGLAIANVKTWNGLA